MKTASRLKLAATVASVVRASTRPGAPRLGERVQAVPRLVRATLDRTYAGTSLGRLALVAAAVAYVASPLDLVPEAILPVIGVADDAVVLTWVVKAFLEETDRFIAWEIGQGLHRPGTSRPGAAQRTPRTRTEQPGHASASPTAPDDRVGTALGTPADAQARLWAGQVADGRRRDRDVTGAAAPGRVVGRLTGSTGASGTPTAGGLGAQRPAAGPRSTGPGRSEGVRLPEGVRQAATDYVLESVRKRLER
jgi:uncharacterized membrane protein YkvA (DUF1232 family)